MDVRMPDGTIIKGVPDGTTKADLAQKLQKSGMAVPADWLAAEKPKAAAPEQSTWDRGVQALKTGAGDTVRGLTSLPMMLNDAPIHALNLGRQALGYQPVQTGAQVLDKYLPAPGQGFGGALNRGLGGVAGGMGIGGALSGIPAAAGLSGALTAQPIQQAVGTGVGALAGEGLRQAGAPGWAQMGGAMLAGGAAGMPRPSDAARRLAERGVQMTPGQLLGGGANTVEQALGSVPFIGDIIKTQRGNAVSSFNTAVLDQALSTVGQKMPKGLSAEEQLTHVRTTLGANYDRILGGMKGDLHANGQFAGGLPAPGQLGAPPAPSLFDELSALKTMGANLPAQQSKDLNRIVDSEILGKFTKAGKASGETLQDINRVLDSEIADYGKSQDPYHQKLGQALKEAQAAVRRMITRENPQAAQKLDANDRAYATFKQAQEAAKRGKDGNYTPSQFESAIKFKDRSKDRRAYTEGTLPNQGLSKDARAVLPNNLPDSGTATRALVESLLLGGGAAMNPGTLAAGAVLPGIYNPATLRALQAAMLNGTAMPTRALNSMNAGAAQQLGAPPQ